MSTSTSIHTRNACILGAVLFLFLGHSLTVVSALAGPLATRRDVFSTAAAVATTSSAFIGPAFASFDNTYQEGPKGLKYLVVEPGDGPKPQRGQKVKTSYTLWVGGWPENGGTQVDSSKGLFGDKPFEFNVGVSQVVKGWDLALMDMRPGESRRLIVPASLGYGDRGAGGQIKPGANLYFSVKLTELGAQPQFNERQLQWLEEHPLGE